MRLGVNLNSARICQSVTFSFAFFFLIFLFAVLFMLIPILTNDCLSIFILAFNTWVMAQMGGISTITRIVNEKKKRKEKEIKKPQ